MRNVTRWAWIGLVMVAACGKVSADDAADVDTDEETEGASDRDAAESTELALTPEAAPPVRIATTGARSGRTLVSQPVPSSGGEPELVEEHVLPVLDARAHVALKPEGSGATRPLGVNLLAGAHSAPEPPPPGVTCTHNVTNQGGRVVAAPKIHRVFWGNYWTQAAHTAEATRNDTTWTKLANSPSFFSRMSEYGIGTGSSGNRLDITTGATGNVTEATFRSSLQTAIVNSGYVPGNNDVFVIFLPSGTASQFDIDNSAGGHHDHFSATIGGASRDIVYAIIDYYATADMTNIVTSHEIAEAVTDPDPEAAPISAWWEISTQAEISDICQGTNRSIAGTLVETTWSQVACRCVGPRDPSGMDYDGDGKPNLTIFRGGQWWANGAPYYWNFGQAGDVPVAGDYNGDGRTEFTLFRPSTHNFFVLDTTSGYYTPYYFGDPGDIPVPADYDGDGQTDKAVFRPSNGTWYVLNSASGGAMTTTAWGQSGDVPLPMDYDGDGKADMTVRRPGDSTWYVLLSGSPGYYTWATWGAPTDKPVTGDFNADGKADWAFFRASEGRFYIQFKDTATAYWVGWGTTGDVPVTRDYDGDWQTDVAVWRPSDGNWYVNTTTVGGTTTQWGTNGDIPVMRMPQ